MERVGRRGGSRGGGVITRYLLCPRSEKCLPFHSVAVHEAMYDMMTSSHVLPLENGRRDGDAPDAPFYGYGGAGGEDEKTEEDVDDGWRES